MAKWLAFFSQTGSEIVNISKEIGRVPDLIVTNNDEGGYRGTMWHPGIRELGTTIMYAQHDGIMNYMRSNSTYPADDTIITLHGYLRIIPADICNKYEMYNGHPALITHYPELKGKDPQDRTWSGDYKIIGSVVHKVTEGVDEGEILSSVAYTNRSESKDELYSKLKQSSLEAWLWFMRRRLCE